MAKIKNQVISGKLGNVIYKTFNGKPYVIAAPEIKESQSEAHLDCKQAFGICGKLGASMSKIKVLRDHWEKSDVDAYSVRNKFSKINYTRILRLKNLSGVTLIYDSNPHPVNLTEYNFSPDGLTCMFKVSPVNNTCKEISMQGIVYLADPKEPGCDKYLSFPFVSANYTPVNGEDYTISARFTSQDAEKVKIYNIKNILLNLAFKNMQGEAEKFSETKIIE
jgi:hypothetical protein